MRDYFEYFNTPDDWDDTPILETRDNDLCISARMRMILGRALRYERNRLRHNERKFERLADNLSDVIGHDHNRYTTELFRRDVDTITNVIYIVDSLPDCEDID